MQIGTSIWLLISPSYPPPLFRVLRHVFTLLPYTAPSPAQTKCRSRPHALSFFSGHEPEGRFPIYELGCSALVPLPLDRDTSSAQSSGGGKNGASNEGPEPCPDLAPRVLMPEIAASFSMFGGSGSGEGVACTLSFGREEGKDDWLSFVVSGATGEEIASLTLPVAT